MILVRYSYWILISKIIYFSFVAKSIAYEKRERRTYLFHGRSAHWKTLHSVPHDLGDPGMLLIFFHTLVEIFFL